MPFAIKPATACSPNISLPTRATNVTLPPALAAATAWFAPLPPAAVTNSPPRIVSPGLGIRSSLRIMSVLELPTTTIRCAMAHSPRDELLNVRVHDQRQTGNEQCKHKSEQAAGALPRVL